MLRRLLALPLLAASAAWSAPGWLLIRTVDGVRVEGQSTLRAVPVDGAPKEVRIADILSIHSATPASDLEKSRIVDGFAAIQGSDRKACDLAVEELTAIGLPVLTPLLDILKDTDQHEPRPLYRLFERIIPSQADGFDRDLSLIRLANGSTLRVKLAVAAAVEIKTASGEAQSIPWSKIRSLAVRQSIVRRAIAVHSIRHCTQIEYLDTGVALSASSKVDSSARGFIRMSFNVDGWASDANGLTKPGAPAYKTNLVDGHPFGALVGRVGAQGDVFFLGRQFTKSGLAAGRLGLAINDNRHWQNNVGSFLVTLTATNAYDLGDAQ